jgi:CCR4-NOT transcription complex subunit 7/8
MDVLKECGLDFQRHKSEGIPHKLFAEYLITSGLVFNPNNHWITFHGGTDYGYLLNLLLSCNLPSKSEDFILHIQRVFQNTYDCKEMMKELNLRGGLTKVA